jgi:hypothetical protein
MCPDLGSSRGSPTAAPDLSHVCPASGRLPAPRRLAGLRVPGLRQCSRGRPCGGAGPPTCTAVSHRAANGPADARPAWPSGIATGPGRWPCLTQPRPQGVGAPLAGNRKRGRWKPDAVMCHLGYGYVHRHYRGPEQPGRRSRLHTGTTSAMSPILGSTRSPRWQQAPQLADGDIVDLVSVWSDGERRAKGFRAVAYRTPRGAPPPTALGERPDW